MAFDRRQQLISEGMSEAEADYMMSGGTKTDGLQVPQGSETYVQDADEPRQVQQQEPVPQQTQAAPAVHEQQHQQAAAEDPDNPEPARDSPFYQQWHREKRRRQELTEQLRQRDERLAAVTGENTQYREHWARLDERLRLFREAAEAPPEQQRPAAPPDRESDPFGYMAWQQQRIDALEERVNGTASQFQEERAATALRQAYNYDAQNFAQVTPDFWPAYRWLLQNRDAELTAAGYGDANERASIIHADERDIAARALTARHSPAQVIYNLAKARGFTMPAAAPAATSGNGAAPVNGAPRQQPANGAPSVTEQVNNIQRGQAASRSLSSGGGSPVPQGLDLASLVAMSDQEFAQWKASATPAMRKELASLMGA